MKERILYQLNECLQQSSVADWMTKGETGLLMKAKSRGQQCLILDIV